MFTKSWVYQWGLLLEFTICAYWVGDHTVAVRACDALPAMPDVPDAVRQQAETNREFSVPHVKAVPRPAAPVRRPKASGAGKAAKTRKR
ncbi:hypothetical protein [Streptomyces sp. NBC_01235]|uniref:hypothetical protein n=1 Tax=Streptomyces sp. NBC_01235 TaxID=2903788 RepID=UPI002E0F7411|nr:hypothetical protein OG289_18050 [Streptomyces sp. NBC_01235]